MTSKRVPDGATQHPNAGPYSPVLIVPAGDLVAISGQGPIDAAGSVVGQTIEEQTQLTLDNCRRQLASAGASFSDVFKVTVHLADLDEWGRFNEVYRSAFTQPFPVRTTTGTALLNGMRVEIDMLARLSS
jgi:2-iminobutanoate/2-iminopropanoate deaminase